MRCFVSAIGLNKLLSIAKSGS